MASVLLGICLDPSVSKVPIVTCMASESTQSYSLFSWPCGNTELTLFLHNAVYCPPRLSLSRYNVCTPFCENDSVPPLLLGPTHLSVHLALSPGLHCSPPCRISPSLGGTFIHITEMSLPTGAPPPSPPWGVCPCMVGQGGLAQIHEAFFQISVRVMRTLSPLHRFTFWIPELGREPPAPLLVLLSSLNKSAKWPSL